jgi:SAM-dependent methyltransferase
VASAVFFGVTPDLAGRYLYFGSLGADEPQFANPKFTALALRSRGRRQIAHDLCDPLPCADSTIPKIQSQDVFEHIPYERLPGILDEVFRVLTPGGLFRMSVPDYRSPLLRARSVFDEHGQVIADLMMGGSVSYSASKGRQVAFAPGGVSHLWFPVLESVQALVRRSNIQNCRTIRFHHYWKSATEYICESFPDDELTVLRVPPRDMRADGKPISIVADFIK